MGASTRHYKALMKKNCITWKRTPCGSICEILCPVILMFILVYARTQVDPVQQEDFSLYSLRRPFYPVAKPEIGNKFAVSIADQERQLNDYRDFFEYMDGYNVNLTVPVNVTQTVEIIAEVAADVTGVPSIATLVPDIKNDIRLLTNVTNLIMQTPIANFNDRIAWDSFKQLIAALGLDGIIDVDAIQAFSEQLEETIENPQTLLADVTGVNITAIVEQALDQIPDPTSFLNQFENINVKLTGYLPLLDFLGPYAFFPSHCYPSGVGSGKLRTVTRYNSPVIAYVKTGASVEQDIIEQLQSLFRFQKSITAGAATINILGFAKNVFDSNSISSFIRDEEFAKVSKQLSDRFGFNATAFSSEDLKGLVPDQGVLAQASRSVGNFTFKEFASQSELDDYIASDKVGTDPNHEGVCFGFSIQENEQKNKYELQLFFNDMWPTWLRSIPNQKRPVWNEYEYTPEIEEYFMWTQQGFAHMQNWVANTILKRKTGVDNASIVAMAVPSRLPPFIDDEFGQFLTGTLSFFMVIMFVPPVYRTTYRIVAEKENKVKESMRMMGLSDFPYWASWYTYYTILNTSIGFFTWLVMITGIISKTDSWILFCIVWLYGQSLFGLILITQSLFMKARAAAITSSIVYFGSSMFQYFVSDENARYNDRLWASFSPPVAMIQTISVMSKFEASQVGSRTENLYGEYNHWTVGDGLTMLFINCFWLLFIGFYLEQVMPKTFGRRRHPCFLCMPSYYSCCRKKNRVKIGSQNEPNNQAGGNHNSTTQNEMLPGGSAMSPFDSIEQTKAFETAFLNPLCYEKLDPEIDYKEQQQHFLKINNLHKEYENGFKAVNGLNVKMYTDQIFCLLGHNGAGKTTTISMLTGLIRSSSGSVSLFGDDVFEQMDTARKTMGVCPQHDVLFDLLTPEEHMDIFYEFKGADKTNKKKEIDALLEDIGVADKRKNLAYQLSGGNKRKLSVAIALCGGSKFVLLDEPTSGLDLQARRQLWNMLRNYKKDRIILLTTHYMDEADILGDRIGIMTAGRMTCLGSSMFLKNRFGVGYVMTIVKTNPVDNTKVMPYLQERLGPHVTKITEIQGEMTVQIPREYTCLFKDFFTDFDDDLADLEIQSYGIAVTTLEQVFLEIGHQTDPKPIIPSVNSDSGGGSRPVSALLTPGRPQSAANQSNATPQSSKGKVLPMELIPPAIANTAQKGQSPEGQGGDQSSFLPLIDGAEPNQAVAMEKNQDENLVIPEQNSQQEVGVSPGGEIEEEPQNQGKKTEQQKDLENPVAEAGEENYERFCLAENKLNTSFCNNFAAVLIKRFQSYSRSKRRVFTEVFLPSAFMIVGVWLSAIDFSYRSDDRLFTPSLYPLKQKLLFNENIYDVENSNLSPAIFAENLPDYEESFDVTYYGEQRGPTFDEFADEVYQFGTQNAKQNPYMYGSYEMFQANKDTQQYKFVSYVNLTSDSSVALFPQFMYESVLKIATGDPEFEFKTRSTVFPPTYEVRRRVATSDAGAIVFFSAIAYSIVITVTISYLVVERITQLKHVQVITGMRLTSYWIANFIFDALKLYITVITTIVLFNIFDQHYETAVYIFILFPFGIMPFTYVFSFCFTADSASQTFTMFCHLVVILLFSTVIFVLRVVPNLELIGDNLHYGMRAIPSYSLATALYTDSTIEFISQIRNSTDLGKGEDISPDPWAFKNNLLDLIMQISHFFFWSLILFLIEIDLGKRLRKCWHACCGLRYPKPQTDLKLDSDVTDEIQRVADTPADQFKIKVDKLRKVYSLGSRALVAVEKISFGLQAGECFALLGVNGAGKSTTFKCLTAEVEPTMGSIHIGAYDIRKDFKNIKKLIGYCPQHNLIFEYMSVEENIVYFARIKGIPADRRTELVERAIKQLDLTNHRKKMAGTLSGGNKRKLSVAIAIVGSPPIILLDEPSAGMDPEARRFMWRVIGKIASDKTSAVILTTHSMDEAEALSTKMGIMVKGGIFKCFGTPQHIKDKFGTGFVVEIKAQMPIKEEIAEVRQGLLNPDSVESPELKEVLKQNTMSAEEASKVLTEAQVPGIVIESILHLDQPVSEGEDQEAVAAELLQRQFSMDEIAQEIFVKGALFGVIESLCREFVHVEVIEHYGSYMRLRLQRHNHSIGFLFKLVEELKEEHQLEDYSVCQTTLEQIFQGFADLKFNENVPTFCIDDESGELAKIIFE